MTQREQLKARLSAFSDTQLDTLRREVWENRPGPSVSGRLPAWIMRERHEVLDAFDEVVSEIRRERKQAEHERLVALLRGVG